MQPITLKPVKFLALGKRSFQQMQPGRQLLRRADTDLQTLPPAVRLYIEAGELTQASEVGQWSVDNEEPLLLRSLYDAGFRGPVTLRNAESEPLLEALLALNQLPLSPLQLRLEFQQRIGPAHALRVAQLLRSNNLCIQSLRLDLSSELTAPQAQELMAALNLLYELQTLQLLVDGRQQAPIAEHLIPVLLGCRRALMLSAEAILPMAVKHWQDFQSPGEASVELKDLVRSIVSKSRDSTARPERDNGYLLFKIALSYGEFHLLRALASLGLAPPQNAHLEFIEYVPDGEALDTLQRWPLSFSLVVLPWTSQRVGAIGLWLAQRPCMDQMTLELDSAIEEAQLQRLARGVAGLGPGFQRLIVSLGANFSIVPSAAPSPADPQAGWLAKLRLELRGVALEQEPAYSAAAAGLIRLLKPRHLEVWVPQTGVALGLLEACGDDSGFAPMACLHIQCVCADRSAASTIDAIQRFTRRFQKLGRFIFDGARGQWDNGLPKPLEGIDAFNRWLVEITLAYPDAKKQRQVWWSGRSTDALRLQYWTFKPEQLDVQAAAERFFGAHLNRHLGDELGRTIIRRGHLSARDRLSLSQVSTATQRAWLESRCLILAKAIIAGQLNVGELQLLLQEHSTGERNLRLVTLLDSHFKERIQQARQTGMGELMALEAGASLLLKEQAMWRWREETRADQHALQRQ